MKSPSTNKIDMNKRYANAQKVLQGFLTKNLALNTNVNPNWIGDSDCFWYVRDQNNGREFRLVDAKTATNEAAFDHQRLALGLAELVQESVDANDLPFATIALELAPRTLRFTAFGKHWQYEESSGACTEILVPPEQASEGMSTDLQLPRGEEVSPDGKHLVFIKANNLWLRDLSSGDERSLTNDGEEDYVYGGPGTAWGTSMGCGLQVRWSPDSQRLYTVQRDTREIKSLPVIHHVPQDGGIRPEVTTHKVSYPGDEHIETLRILTIDVNTGEQQSADYHPIPVTRNSWGFFVANLGWWHRNSRLAYFVDVDRYYKYVRVLEFDTDTGKTRVLFEETSDTQINLMANGDMWPSFVPLPESNELLWYSERSGWAHLYLYDLSTGELKNTVTQGEWLVRDIVTVNLQRREAFIQTACRTPGRNPYYRDLVKVNIDTGDILTLASSNHDYFAGAFTDMQGTAYSGLNRKDPLKRGTSPNGNYTVLTRSRVDTLPQSFVVDCKGESVLELEEAEVVGAPAGWRLPEPVSLFAVDGKTEINGTIFKPSYFELEEKYPVIIDVFNTPDFPWSAIGSFDSGIFEGQNFFSASALAELGFIVVQIDGRGSSFRDCAFKAVGYGNLRLPAMLDDQVAGLKQLGERYSYMDMERVGIIESVGGPAALDGLLEYPEFYQVGVANIPHDARLMAGSMWSDMYEGEQRLEQKYPEQQVESLQGKLLLMGGMLDLTTPPAGTFRLIEAFQKANKNFDMVLLPNVGHGFSVYLVRRAWDYLVQHLLGEQPPENFKLTGVFGQD